MNATRYEVAERLGGLGLPVQRSDGGATRANRVRLGLGKDHYVDALCVGDVAATVADATNGFLAVARSNGRGSHQRSKPVFRKPCWGCGKTFSNGLGAVVAKKSKAAKLRNKFCPDCRAAGTPDNGFRYKKDEPDQGKAPLRYYDAPKSCFGFTTGDLVEARVPTGKKKGTYVGRVAIRARGSFNVTTATGVVSDISHKYCRLIERGNDWSFFTQRRPVLLPAPTGGASAPEEAW